VPEQPQKVIANAALLSNLSQFVGVVMAPRRSSVFKHIEFVRLSERRVLVIIVSPEGDVQNRVIFTDRPRNPTARSLQFPQRALRRFGHRAGARALEAEVESLRGEIAT
jgi:heat-inducible transcriptional repressor